MLNFKLDDREHSQELKDAFKVVSIQRQFDYEISHLQIGDVQCGNVVIERKEAHDFVSSIMDGRLKEQAHKMQFGFEFKYVIVEGDIFNTGSMISDNAIIGQMTSLLVKYGVGLMFVKNSLQFVEACYSIVKKHGESHTFNESFIPSTIPNKTDEDIMALMLMQIKGISWDKARDIATMYDNSISTLVNNVTIKDLQRIDGIGKVVATRVYEFMKK